VNVSMNRTPAARPAWMDARKEFLKSIAAGWIYTQPVIGLAVSFVLSLLLASRFI
jgi:hypothetical protein